MFLWFWLDANLENNYTFILSVNSFIQVIQNLGSKLLEIKRCLHNWWISMRRWTNNLQSYGKDVDSRWLTGFICLCFSLWVFYCLPIILHYLFIYVNKGESNSDFCTSLIIGSPTARPVPQWTNQHVWEKHWEGFCLGYS